MPNISRLDKVETGRKKEPLRFLIYGPPGVGKSTLAAHAEAPIFLDVEKGSGHLEVTRYPLDHNFDGVLFAVGDLINSDHKYKTLVIDTADALEGLIWQHLFDNYPTDKGGKAKNIESYGYGKGYKIAQQEWRRLLARLEELRLQKNMQVIFVAHSHIKNFKNPSGEDWDRYQLRTHQDAAGLLSDWCDIVGFAHFEEGTRKTESGQLKGIDTGLRVLGLRRTATSDAKARVVLPATLVLDADDPWAPLSFHLNAARDLTPPKLIFHIKEELARIGDVELSKAVEKTVKQNKTNTAALSRYLMRLRDKEAKE